MSEDNHDEEVVEKNEEETLESGNQEKDELFSDGSDPSFKWYVVHVLSGQENKVKKALRERILNHSLQDKFSEIYVPEESVVLNVNGKKRRSKKKFFPGYLMIKMVMNDETWHVVKNTDKVTGFIGADKLKPSPISDEEAAYLTNKSGEGIRRQKTTVDFAEGDNVRVIEGPFASFVGVVEHVNEKGKIKVQVSIFGRPTPVELDFSQVEKVS